MLPGAHGATHAMQQELLISIKSTTFKTPIGTRKVAGEETAIQESEVIPAGTEIQTKNASCKV
jgi:hypothetical protein